MIETTQRNLVTCQKCMEPTGVKFERGCVCPVDKKDLVYGHVLPGYCPKQLYQVNNPAPPAASARALSADDIMKIKGPLLWRRMHTSSLLLTDNEDRQSLIDSTTTNIPCGPCKAEWLELLKSLPPDYSSADAFFRWTWQAHQAVNERLGKLGLTLEAATAMYKPK